MTPPTNYQATAAAGLALFVVMGILMIIGAEITLFLVYGALAACGAALFNWGRKKNAEFRRSS
jgi:hypothetical protein